MIFPGAETSCPRTTMQAPDLDLTTCEYDVQRKHAADQRLARLLQARTEEEKRRDGLAEQLRVEEEDVVRLEGMSWAAFVATLRGIKDERLKAERSEYVAAKLRYDECTAALDALRTQIDDVAHEVKSLEGAEARYQAALAAREQQVLASAAPERERVAAVAREIGAERARIHELDEAAAAAHAAIKALETVHKSLDDAASWGALDTWAGGGLISTAIKHGHIDEASRAAGHARQALQRLDIELTDVGVESGALEVRLGEFDTFADFFFDNIWTNLGVQDRIKDAQRRVIHAAEQVQALRTRVGADIDRARERIEQLETKRRTLLRAAPAEANQRG